MDDHDFLLSLSSFFVCLLSAWAPSLLGSLLQPLPAPFAARALQLQCVIQERNYTEAAKHKQLNGEGARNRVWPPFTSPPA